MILPRKKYLNSLTKKIVSSAILLFNNNNELLIVKPNYKDHWSLPGGTSEKNESPYNTCLREVEEEISLKFKEITLSAIFYRNYLKDNAEAIHLFFYGGYLNKNQTNSIKINLAELENYRFVPINKLAKYNKVLAKRILMI